MFLAVLEDERFAPPAAKELTTDARLIGKMGAVCAGLARQVLIIRGLDLNRRATSFLELHLIPHLKEQSSRNHFLGQFVMRTVFGVLTSRRMSL